MKNFEQLKKKIKENFLTQYETDISIEFCDSGHSFIVLNNSYDDTFTVCLLRPDGELSGKSKTGKTIKTVTSFVERVHVGAYQDRARRRWGRGAGH
jgi:hypothetical protein